MPTGEEHAYLLARSSLDDYLGFMADYAADGAGADRRRLVAEWKAALSGLEAIDWSKKNPEWENICIIANSVVSNRQARAATKAPSQWPAAPAPPPAQPPWAAAEPTYPAAPRARPAGHCLGR